MNRKAIQREMRDSNRAKRVQMVLLLPLVMLLSACSVSGGGTLLGKSMSDGVFSSPFSTAEARAVNGASIEQPVAMLSEYNVDTPCNGCVIEPMVEYIDVDVPECVQPVTTITHRPTCKVCSNFSVSMRSRAGPVSCGKGDAR
ncbi:MAG: hypothetical protein HOL04_11860 [Gammaproteobacteria bacterium]|jgi:hypothetical protein|nr:hypothetical protein [Gammaproteobacteria bacterium]MBT4607899.1 hypothetical protein [Thiotrichales bacterium]MBT4080809.1 hypothetical protein [Gammaproteobacteria bacterium]MBT4330624.1 hypothetical protein [Gammaproteobacteria bacterium]MBT4812023.1 hypothetical protein [Thiotrichales bacterium]